MFDWLLEFVSTYGLLAIFIIVLLEYSCFPFPSEVVLPTAGAIAVSMNISFGYVLLICTIAGIIGATICYSVGYYGGKPIIDKVIKKYPKTEKGIVQSTKTYDKYSNLSVCVGRVIPLCRTYISFIAGVARQNIYKYLLFSTIGILLWNSLLILLGYVFYDNIEYVATLYSKYRLIIIIIAIIGLSFIAINLLIKKVKYKKLNQIPKKTV